MLSTRQKIIVGALSFVGLYLLIATAISVMRGYASEPIARQMIKRQYRESKIDSLYLKPQLRSMRVARFRGECVLHQKEFKRGFRFDLKIDYPHFLNFWQSTKGQLEGFRPAKLKDLR